MLVVRGVEGVLRCLAAYFSDKVNPRVDDMDVSRARRASERTRKRERGGRATTISQDANRCKLDYRGVGVTSPTPAATRVRLSPARA